GDSQTFGEEVDDVFTWPSILAQKRPDLEIINLAVSGYGLDQMYVTFTEEFDLWKPDVVVVAPLRDDFYRTALLFRDYSKPWFEPPRSASGTGVDLIQHPPVADMDQVVRTLGAAPLVTARRLRLANLFLSAIDNTRTVPRNWSRAAVLTTEIMRRMLERCRSAGVPLLFVLIGNFRAPDAGRDGSDPGERVYRQTCEALAP